MSSVVAVAVVRPLVISGTAVKTTGPRATLRLLAPVFLIQASSVKFVALKSGGRPEGHVVVGAVELQRGLG